MSTNPAGEVSDPTLAKAPSGEPNVTELNMAQKEGELDEQNATALSLADKRRVRMMRFDKKNTGEEQLDTAAAAAQILETKEKR